MAKLILRYPDNVIKEVEFNQPKYKIGKDEDNDLILENDEVDSHQSEIETKNGVYTLINVSENESTAINGKKITRENLNYGDRIAFGPIIGLFYPTKKKKVKEKTKLFMYIAAGAIIIILPIVFIFFITTRQIKTVVSKELTGKTRVEEFKAKEPEKGLMVGSSKAEAESSKAEAESSKAEALEEKESPKERKLSILKKLRKKEKLVLPEPDIEIISNRKAIAVPKGILRLFFKKIPVYVKEESHEVKLESLNEEKKENLLALVKKEAGEVEPLEGGEKESIEGEKRFFQRVLGGIKNLFKRKKKEIPEEGIMQGEGAEEEEITEKEGTEEVPATVEKIAKVKKPAVIPPKETDIQLIVDPLALLSEKEIPEIKGYEIKEKPIYSKNEIEEFKKEYYSSNIKLSGVESANFDILWKYPRDKEKIGSVIRTGALGRLEKAKNYDFIFGTKSGRLIVLNGSTGDEILNQDMGRPFFEPIIEDVDGDKQKDIILVFENGDIVSYTKNMEMIWNYKAPGSITSLPLVVDINKDNIGDLVFADMDMDVIAIDGRTGFELWRFFDAESEIVYSPISVDINNDGIRDVVFSTVNGFLYGVDGKTGWGLWKRNIFGRPAGLSSVSDLNQDKKEDIVSLTENGILSCYRKDGKLLFVNELGSNYLTPPAIGDTDGDGNNDIVAIDKYGILKDIEGMTRREKWSFETGEGLTAGRLSLADVNNDGGMDVVFATLSGLLFVIDGISGAQMAIYNFNDYLINTPLIFDINRDKIVEIVICTYGGEEYALQIAEREKHFFLFKKSGWITVNHDNGNTGNSQFYLLRNPWK